MSIENRKYFYAAVTVDGDTELDYLSKTRVPMNLSTVVFHRVSSNTENRLDLISLKYYGNYNLGWLIAEHNDILDPLETIVIGVVLKIPALDEYYQYYNRYTRSP